MMNERKMDDEEHGDEGSIKNVSRDLAPVFESLLSNLGYANRSPSEPATIGVTGTAPRQGTSTIAFYLALHLSQNLGSSTLLVETSPRTKQLRRQFGVSTPLGFAEATDDVAEMDVLVKDTEIPRLFVLPNGRQSLVDVSQENLAAFCSEALKSHEVVVLDLGIWPTELGSLDAALLDHIILVIDSSQSNSVDFRKAPSDWPSTSGVLINRHPIQQPFSSVSQ